MLQPPPPASRPEGRPCNSSKPCYPYRRPGLETAVAFAVHLIRIVGTVPVLDVLKVGWRFSLVPGKLARRRSGNPSAVHWPGMLVVVDICSGETVAPGPCGEFPGTGLK